MRRGAPGVVLLANIFVAVFGLRSGPDGSGQAVGFIWSLFRAKPSILDPFRTKFDVFGPDPNFGQPALDLGRLWPILDQPWADFLALHDQGLAVLPSKDFLESS